MAQQLTETYRAAMAQPVRRPRVVVTAYPQGTPCDPSADLVACGTERTWEQQAGTATLTVANMNGRYDPSGLSGRETWLAVGTRVEIAHGLVTDAGVETLPVFTGEVESVTANYRRGEGETLTVRLLDLAGRFAQQECTTRLFSNTPVNDIVQELFTTLGGLPGAQLWLDPVAHTVAQAQFVEETLMDAGALLMQAVGRRLYFDAGGVLRNGPLAPAAIVDWPLGDSDDYLAFTFDYGRPSASRVVVTGALQAPVCQLGSVVMWQEVTVSNYNYGTTVDVPFHPSGAKFTDVTVTPVTTLAPTEQVVLYSVNGDSITVKVLSPGGRTITFQCSGRQVYYTTPHIATTVDDPNLIALCGYGRVREVTNAFVDTQDAADTLATTLLAHLWAERLRVTVRLRAHPGIEPGDVLQVTNPRTGAAVKLHAMTVGYTCRRGAEEYTTVDGVLLPW